MEKKVTRRINNWSQYNRALVNRGDITVWLPEDVSSVWYAEIKENRGRGRPAVYSDGCIELILTLRHLFRLPLRGAQGFIQGLLQLQQLELSVPDYSVLSKRAGTLQIALVTHHQPGEKINIALDSTGLKIYGEGEWKMRIHGKSKRRTWRKLHIAIDPATFETLAAELTHSNVHDGQIVESLLNAQQNIQGVYGDGAYHSTRNFEAIAKTGARAFIPLPTGSSRMRGNSPGVTERNRLHDEIWNAGGKNAWKKTSGYHRRSLVETQMFRIKQCLGDKLASRKQSNQVIEVRLKLAALNRMSRLGMPAYASP